MNLFYRNYSITLILCLVLFFTFSLGIMTRAYSQIETVQLNEEVRKVSLTEHLEILTDPNQTLKIEELLTPYYREMFKTHDSKMTNTGLVSEVYWLKFNAVDFTEKKAWLLEFADPLAEEVVLYSPTATGAFTQVKIGKDFSDSAGVYSSYPPVFELSFQDEQEHLFFLRVKSQSATHSPVTIWSNDAFYAQSKKMTAWIGLFGGLCFVYFFWCIYRYYLSRQKAYVYLFLLSFMTMIFSSTWNGWSVAYIWPQFEWLNEQSILIFSGITSIFLLLVTKELLSPLFKRPWLAMTINSLLVVDGLFIVLSFFAYSVVSPLFFVISFIGLIFSLTVAVYAWNMQLFYAAYYIASLCLSLSVVIITFFTAIGALPVVELVQYMKGFVIWLSFIFVALALYSREKAIIKTNAIQDAHTEKAVQSIVAERTPLYGMIGIAETLKARGNGNVTPSTMNQLNNLAENGKSMTRVVNELLNFSNQAVNQSSSVRDAVHLHELVDEVLSFCRPLIEKKPVQLYHIVPKTLPEVLIDKVLLQQTLFNLIEHSIHLTEKGEIVVSACTSASSLEISVTDTGAGISKQQIASLLEWESSQKLTKENQDMGLKIAKKLIELQQGKFTIESQENTGSTFSFVLPLELEETSSQPSLREANKEMMAYQLADSLVKQQTDIQNLQILVIDSDETNRLELVNQLTLANYHVHGVGDGKTAVDLLSRTAVDLLVVDGSLLDMTGDELCRLVRLEFTLTELPILMLSEKDEVEEKKAAFKAGANDYLLKPCDKEEFLLRVETLSNMRSLTQEITNLNYFLERNVKEQSIELEITNMNLSTVSDEIQEIEKSRNDMLSAISHELGTPITLIHSYIQAVKESLIEENNPRYLDMIHKKLLLLERLTEDLVELSEFKSGQMTLRIKEHELREWIEHLKVSMASDVMQSDRAFEFLGVTNHVNHQQVMVSIDQDRIDQVVANILWNSVKHTSTEDGKITLAIEIQDGQSDHTLLNETAGGNLLIRIADNGSGIKKEDLPHIFERFYKTNTSESYKGSGLGLAITKEIVLAHNGKIWAESTEGHGSVFVIVLPLKLR